MKNLFKNMMCDNGGPMLASMMKIKCDIDPNDKYEGQKNSQNYYHVTHDNAETGMVKRSYLIFRNSSIRFTEKYKCYDGKNNGCGNS